MKKFFFFLILLLLSTIWTCSRIDDSLSNGDEIQSANVSDGDIIPGQYIVLLKVGIKPEKSSLFCYDEAQGIMRSKTQKVLHNSGISDREPVQVYGSVIEGFTIQLSRAEAMALEKNPAVEGVYPDKMVYAEEIIPDKTAETKGKPKIWPMDPAVQWTPGGIKTVGGVPDYQSYTGYNNEAWILSTGIDLDHPDLNVDITKGKNFVSTKPPNDDNGRGTFSAGVIAALNNSYGVIGVAPGARVVPVKVLNQRNIGTMSNILAGLNYAYANAAAYDVIDIPFLIVPPDPAFDNAVIACGARPEPLFVTIPAGGNADDVSNYSPARANGQNIFTVAAITVDFYDGTLEDPCTYYSAFGEGVDYYCPGSNVYSTSMGGYYVLQASTAPAASHLAGVLLVTHGTPASYESLTCNIFEGDGWTHPVPHTGYGH
jgi:hypothetical protein